MKPPPAPRPHRALTILWLVPACTVVGVLGYWFYLSYVSSLSADTVRAEGAAVVAILEEHKTAHGYYPRALDGTRVAERKFPRGVALGYTPAAGLRAYELLVSGGGHTWRYHSAAGVWEPVPAGSTVGGVE